MLTKQWSAELVTSLVQRFPAASKVTFRTPNPMLCVVGGTAGLAGSNSTNVGGDPLTL